MLELLRTENKFKKHFYVLLSFILLISCLLMLPICRTNIINLAEFALHKNLNYEFWNTILLYTLVTTSSFAFYWLASSVCYKYTKSEKFDLKKTMILISLLLFVISLLVQTVVLYDGIVYGLDDPAYVAIAKAMAENTYKTDFTRMSNPDLCIRYAIGYPSLIAIPYKIFGMNYYAIKFVNVLLYAIFVVIFFNFLFWLIKDISISLFVSCLFCLNFTLSNWQNHTMSDTPCMVLSLFSIVLIYNIYFSESKKKYLKAVLLGFCFFIAYECRMNGLVCFLTLFSMQILICISKFLHNSKFFGVLVNGYYKIDWKLHLVPYIVFIAFVVIQTIIYPTLPRYDSFYLDNLSFKVILENFSHFHFMYRFYSSAWNEVFHQFNELSKTSFYLSLLLALYGIIKNWKKLAIIIIFTIGNTIIYCLWKAFCDFRFYMPLYISLAVFCAYGAKSIKDCFNEKAATVLTIIGKFSVIMFCAMFTVSIFPFYTENFKDAIKKNGHSYSVEAQDIWEYINKNIPEDRTFIFRSPTELYLYTKHIIADSDKADYYLHNFEIPVDVERKNILTDESVADTFIEISGRQFELEYCNDKFRLFHVN